MIPWDRWGWSLSNNYKGRSTVHPWVTLETVMGRGEIAERPWGAPLVLWRPKEDGVALGDWRSLRGRRDVGMSLVGGLKTITQRGLWVARTHRPVRDTGVCPVA